MKVFNAIVSFLTKKPVLQQALLLMPQQQLSYNMNWVEDVSTASFQQVLQAQ